MKFNLKSVLLANALFSGGSGLAMSIAHKPLAEWMGLHEPLALVVIGLALIVFSAFLFWLRGQTVPPAMLVTTVIIQDLLWVAGSVLIIVLKPFGLNASGYMLIGIVAVVVFVFAVMQWKGRVGVEK